MIKRITRWIQKWLHTSGREIICYADDAYQQKVVQACYKHGVVMGHVEDDGTLVITGEDDRVLERWTAKELGVSPP